MTPHLRYIEIDAARTIAIIGMVVYHALYDVMVFRGWDIDIFSPGWIVFARLVASLFLLLVGVSFAISWDRARGPRYIKYFRRAMWILAGGFAISIVTYIVDPHTYVRFGILHLIAIVTLILPGVAVCLRRRSAASLQMILGIICIIVGFIIPQPTFTSVDYFPLFPWLGVVLIGVAMGNLLYVRGYLQWHMADTTLTRTLTWPGRWSLWIYLLHQPILFALTYILVKN